MATNVDTINDQLQKSATAQGAWNVCSGLSTAVLRALCDLNHLPTTGSRDALITRLAADVHGAQDAGVERVARALGQAFNISS